MGPDTSIDSPLSIYGALAVAYDHGTRLTLPTFRGYVSNGDAPKPAAHVGRQPFWERSEITAWASEFLRDARKQEPVQGPGRLELEIIDHLNAQWLELDSEQIEVMSDAELAFECWKRLPGLISRLRNLQHSWAQKVKWHADELELYSERSGLPSLATVLQWMGDRRVARQCQEELERVQEKHLHTSNLLSVAEKDLDRCETWLAQLRGWARWSETLQRDARESAALERWWDALDAEVETWSGRAVPMKEFAMSSPDHVSYVMDEGDWGTLSEQQRNAADSGAIVLSGADYGYYWTVPGWSGRWRLSWILSSGELYLEYRNPHEALVVIPVAKTPAQGRTTSMADVSRWLEPFERIQRRKGTLGLLAREIGVQSKLGWPSLVRDEQRAGFLEAFVDRSGAV